MKRVALVGARGHVGAELVRLLADHPVFEVALVTSRERVGQPVADYVSGVDPALRYTDPDAPVPTDTRMDAWILALPNGKAAGHVERITAHGDDAVIIDLSADFRFDERWYYGLPELTRARYRGQRHISNPGCYATAMQLAIAPMRELLAGPVQCFGVSGYSGAGTTPGERNNPEVLRDNLMPYALTGHLHEREVTRHCAPVEFMPHVAPHFRGLTVTANLHLARPCTLDEVRQRYLQAYDAEPLVGVQADAPWVSHVARRHGVLLGGFALDEAGTRLVTVATLDNLLKGAATQALQNLNLAFGLDEYAGIALEPEA